MLATLPGIGCKPTYTKKNQSDKARALNAGSETDDTRARSAEALCRKTNGRRNGTGFAFATAQPAMKTSAKKPSRHSPLRYYGGKANIARQLVTRFAPHNCFVDVFGGGANILLAKPPGSGVEVLNDVDQSLVNFWSVLRNSRTRKRMIELVEFTPYSRLVFKQCVDELATGDRSDPVRWAWAFFVTSNQSRNAVKVDWAYGKSFWNGNASSWATLPQRLALAAKRLKKVQIENLEWEDCVRRYDAPDTLFVMDPPYHSHTRVSPTVYAHEMSRDDHERLLKVACKLKGKVLICGYRHELYDRMLKNWARVELHSRSFASPRTGGKLQDRTEQVWMNYPQ
jgi:DNA adenine methylase